ncbi:MAG TPA: alpha/beta hydrolase fold domain-containing protein, partial [Gaiellaceae bacterium]|nr:alpha/beta hydrolase fold domain-containing protein [Gaiellaceae bacterium]
MSRLAPEIAEQLRQDAELGATLDGLDYIEQRPLIQAAVAQRFPAVEELTAALHVEEHEVTVSGGAVRLHVYRPLTPGRLGAYFHIHGGGFTLGSIDDLFTVAKCAHICAAAGCTVTTVDYRLAPEFPYPIAAEDCYAALCWVVAHAPLLGIDESRIVVGGESAGGNLAAAVTLM